MRCSEFLLELSESKQFSRLDRRKCSCKFTLLRQGKIGRSVDSADVGRFCRENKSSRIKTWFSIHGQRNYLFCVRRIEPENSRPNCPRNKICLHICLFAHVFLINWIRSCLYLFMHADTNRMSHVSFRTWPIFVTDFPIKSTDREALPSLQTANCMSTHFIPTAFWKTELYSPEQNNLKLVLLLQQEKLRSTPSLVAGASSQPKFDAAPYVFQADLDII